MKKLTTLLVTAMLAMAVLVGCGENPEKDMYEADVLEFVTFVNAFQELDNSDVLAYGQATVDLAEAMNMQSEEGTVIKNDFKELGEALVQVGEGIENLDQDAVDAASAKMEEVNSRIEDDALAFGNKCDEVGVSDETLEGLYY